MSIVFQVFLHCCHFKAVRFVFLLLYKKVLYRIKSWMKIGLNKAIVLTNNFHVISLCYYTVKDLVLIVNVAREQIPGKIQGNLLFP